MDGYRKARALAAGPVAPSRTLSPPSAVSGVAATPPTSDAGRQSSASVAVLPFTDLSAAKNQEWFCDGIAEEIINTLARIPGLKVIARTSAFAFKGQSVAVGRIADALGVATVLEGSVRRAREPIRVTAQLVNARDGSHVWSQRYDHNLADVIAVQDDIASAIAGELRGQLVPTSQMARSYTPHVATKRTSLPSITSGTSLPIGSSRR